MKKKVLLLVLVIALVASLAIGLVACNKDDSIKVHDKVNDGVFKVGLICLHGQNSTYDKNFIDAMEVARNELGLEKTQIIVKEDIPEDNTCYEEACNLADDGCDLIFADSFGHEAFIMQAALEYPYVRFCHATGTSEHVKGLSNFHNAFAAIYEGRYLAGVAAGLKLNDMIAKNEITPEQAVIGYVGAFPYAEVKSGYTAFFLGARSVCESATMKVKFTMSWYNLDKEYSTASTLINDENAVLISQHADSMGAPNACKEKGVPNVTYNVSTKKDCPDSYLIGSKINWAPYFKYIITQTMNGQEIDTDWVGTIENGAVEVLELNDKVAAADTADKLAEVKAGLEAGTIRVFDVSKFTVDGKTITEFMADVHPDEEFKADTNVVKTVNGITYIAESEFRSAPYFTLDIDGITILK